MNLSELDDILRADRTQRHQQLRALADILKDDREKREALIERFERAAELQAVAIATFFDAQGSAAELQLYGRYLHEPETSSAKKLEELLKARGLL